MPVTTGHEDAIEIVACGSPLTGHQFRVVDDTGREVPERRQGRLQFNGPSSTVGYHENAEATREPGSTATGLRPATWPTSPGARSI